MKKIRLPNQLSIATLNCTEARVLYHEIFTAGSYLKHGIQLKKNDCIFDVGANIGIFSLYANSLCPELKLFAFEPVPKIFSVLKRNILDHLSGKEVHLYNIGLSNKNSSVVFQYNTHLSMTAGMYATDLEKTNQKNASLYQWLYALLADFAKTNHRFAWVNKSLINGLRVPLLRVLILLLLIIPLGFYLLFLKIATKKVTCTLKTLSTIINDSHIEQIDLCKIDVEGSEWDVLQGIEDDHWCIFKQMIIEVHNLDNRVEKVGELLEQKGFKVIVDQEDWELHRLMNIYTVYAMK